MKTFKFYITQYNALFSPNIDVVNFSNFGRFLGQIADCKSSLHITESNLDSNILESFKKNFDLSHISPMERRRLNNAAKCTFSLISNMKFDKKPYIIFSSFSGEINRCFEMLHSLLNDFISPTAFSLSVLNATPALVSIATKNQFELSALSANPSLEYAILNAYAKLKDTNEKEPNEVLILNYYEKLKELDSKDSTFFMSAFTMSLDKQSKNDIACEMSYKTQNLELDSNNAPQILSDFYFLNALYKKSEYEINDGNLQWRGSFNKS